MTNFVVDSYLDFEISTRYGFSAAAEDVLQRPEDQYVFVRQVDKSLFDHPTSNFELSRGSNDAYLQKLTDTPFILRMRNAAG